MESPPDLNRMEGDMRAPDAIMEPGMGELVMRYLSAQGKPEDVVETLTSGYEGAPRHVGPGGGGGAAMAARTAGSPAGAAGVPSSTARC